MLGYPDQAMRMCNEKEAHARQLGHAFNLGYALTMGAYAFDYRCEPEQLLERAREAGRLAREQGIPTFMKRWFRRSRGWRACAAAVTCRSRSSCCARGSRTGTGLAVTPASPT